MSTIHEPCPICGVVDCGGVIYPHMVSRFLAGKDREHWRRIHDRVGGTVPPVHETSPEDAALQAYVARHGCCG